MHRAGVCAEEMCMEQGMSVEQETCTELGAVHGADVHGLAGAGAGDGHGLGRRGGRAGRLVPAALILTQHQDPRSQIPAPSGGQGKPDKGRSLAHELQQSGTESCS